jgi:protease-4
MAAKTTADMPKAAAGGGGSSASAAKKGAAHHVVLELRGSYPEVPGPLEIAGGRGKTLRDLLRRIDRLASDDEVKSIIVRITPLSLGMANAEEIRGALLAASKKGKPLECHLESAGDTEYYIATACKTIALSPAGDVFLVGPHVEAMFVKGLLDKLGVVADFEHQGKYKGAADSLQRDTMSPEQREATDALLDGATDRIVEAVAKARGVSAAVARGLLDKAPFSAQQARTAGLVDRLANFEAFRDEVAGKDGWETAEAGEPKPAPPNIFDLFGPGKPPVKGPRVTVVYLVGPIVHGRGGGGLLPSQEVASREIISELEKLAADEDVKAVVLRIDSPGGSALASDLIWSAVRDVAAKKPMLASMGDVAASGGYYIAAGAQKIYAQPDTITGSIGVIGGKLVLGGLYDKLGVHKEILTRGARAAMFTEARPFTPDERQAVVTMMHDTYGQFLDRVVAGRHLTRSQLEPIAQGRVWSGADALSRKLVDKLGGLDEAVAEAKDKGKLPADATVDVFPQAPTLKDLFDRLGGGDDARVTLLADLTAALGVTDTTRGLGLVHGMLSFEHEHVQAILPFGLELK